MQGKREDLNLNRFEKKERFQNLFKSYLYLHKQVFKVYLCQNYFKYNLF